MDNIMQYINVIIFVYAVNNYLMAQFEINISYRIVSYRRTNLILSFRFTFCNELNKVIFIQESYFLSSKI